MQYTARYLAGAALVALSALAPATPAMAAEDLIVQSTTSIRDTGLMENVIIPQFRKQHPEYNLKFVAVGTGQAITNARAGQGDVLIMHAPPLEQQFVADGFSVEPVGRLMAWNDFVILGPASDPAGVAAKARNDAAGAFEAIAAAGAAGKAHFVSRGDNSGTNLKERELWKLTSVVRNAKDEPAAGSGSPSWYHRAGVGQADMLRLTEQCPFAGGGCYTITDRGTYAALVRNGAVKALTVRMDDQAATARGGKLILINPYHVYAVNPQKFAPGQIEAKGAQAFLQFMVSERFQRLLTRYPSSDTVSFFAAAEAAVDVKREAPKRIDRGDSFTVKLKLASAVPGAAPLEGMGVRLARRTADGDFVTIARDTADTRGRASFKVKLSSTANLYVTAPSFRDLTALEEPVGRVVVKR